MSITPSCLIVDADQQHARRLAEFCEDRGWHVTLHDLNGLVATGTEGVRDDALREALDSRDWDAAFIDTSSGPDFMRLCGSDLLDDCELFAMTDTDSGELAEACIRAGFSHYFCKPFAAENLGLMLDDIREEVEASAPGGASETVQTLDQFGLIRGSSRPMRKLFRLLRKVGPTDTTALVIGESGTGKELVAETLHAVSNRSDGPYLTLNCSALAENLIESELFGHEKGSFSGAHKQHQGFFERADGGTLFLDEITEMLPDLQAKLLRTLESGEVRRVGAVEPLQVDVRVIAATNRDPMTAVADGQLREDLYYRLAHIAIRVPPLRRRGPDIAGLAQFFLMQLNERHDTSLRLNDDALMLIESYDWPGNVRQLRHAIERAYIVSEGEIGADAFHFEEEGSEGFASTEAIDVALGMSLAEVEKKVILANLDHADGNKKATADVLGISLKTLYNKLKDYES